MVKGCRFSLSLSLSLSHIDRRTHGRVESSEEARLLSEFGVDEAGSDEGVICSCLWISGFTVDCGFDVFGVWLSFVVALLDFLGCGLLFQGRL